MAAPRTATETYLAPILEAAALLQLRPYRGTVEQLTALLDKLSPRGFPQDVLPRLEALRLLAGDTVGTVEELEILDRVWPGESGTVSYKLTATTLTRQWSPKYGGYATITLPFPTVLPLTVQVVRWTDMDNQDSHGDECHPDADECNCEAQVEQTVSATVTDWNAQTEAQLADWLARAVTGDMGDVLPATFPAAGGGKGVA